MSITIDQLWYQSRKHIVTLNEAEKARMKLKNAFFAGAQGVALELSEMLESGASYDFMLEYLDEVSQESGEVFRDGGTA